MKPLAVIDALLNLVFPPHCVACNAAGDWLCVSCIASIPYSSPPLCAHCGRPVAQKGICSLCQGQPSHLMTIRALSPHRAPLRRAIHALKYEGVRIVAEPLGGLLADYWPTQHLAADLVVPVPLHAARQRQRGYNQSALLARIFGEQLGLSVTTVALSRIRNTPSQVGLSRDARWDNVWGAFRSEAGSLSGARVLLVDDVLTSGATLEACAAALLQASASQVHALTLTRALGDPQSPQ